VLAPLCTYPVVHPFMYAHDLKQGRWHWWHYTGGTTTMEGNTFVPMPSRRERRKNRALSRKRASLSPMGYPVGPLTMRVG
jgi:hypothetical protein